MTASFHFFSRIKIFVVIVTVCYGHPIFRISERSSFKMKAKTVCTTIVYIMTWI